VVVIACPKSSEFNDMLSVGPASITIFRIPLKR